MRPANPSLSLEEFSKLSPKQKLTELVRFALLAPSSHNTQPWLFRLGDNNIEVLYDPKRLLAVSDPTGREMYISLGAAIQNIFVAAEYFGFGCRVLKNPPSFFGGSTVANIILDPGTASAGKNLELIQAIFTRHNNRSVFEPRMPDPEFMVWLKAQGGAIRVNIFSDQAAREKIAGLVGDALKIAVDSQDFRDELSQWIKNSSQKHVDGMPGYNLGMPAPVALVFPKILRRFKMGSTQRKMEMAPLLSAPVFVVLSTDSDSADSWLAVGRMFEQIALRAESAGLKIGVLAAAIEVPEFNKKLTAMLQNPAGKAQMFFRLGYSSRVPKPSPRLAAEQVIIS